MVTFAKPKDDCKDTILICEDEDCEGKDELRFKFFPVFFDSRFKEFCKVR
jgi:hypothetical protein